MKLVYTVWFRNSALPSTDPDYEWPACFVIDGNTEQSTLAWGNHLAQRYARTTQYHILSSQVEPLDTTNLPGVEALPLVTEGYEASDAELEW